MMKIKLKVKNADHTVEVTLEVTEKTEVSVESDQLDTAAAQMISFAEALKASFSSIRLN